jgi:phosphopantothenoylcysteine decarboxylase
MRKKIIVVAPAMNTGMWHHPITQKHIKLLEEEWCTKAEGGWVETLRPIEKELACGDTGSGAMCSWEVIVSRVKELVLSP